MLLQSTGDNKGVRFIYVLFAPCMCGCVTFSVRPSMCGFSQEGAVNMNFRNTSFVSIELCNYIIDGTIAMPKRTSDTFNIIQLVKNFCKHAYPKLKHHA